MTTAPDEAGGGVPPVADHADIVPGGVLTRRAPATAFEVTLENFTGPFDLLLGLISKHKLDITEISLATVTDDFIAHIKVEQAKPGGWDLSQATDFLLVAATLLDLKAARLLPQSGPEDEDDLALIEARDILFARLLQYRAFKDIAHTFAQRMATAGRMQPRTASLEPHLAALLPELLMTVTPEQLALIAARAMVPKQAPTVGLAHLHAPAVSVREQAVIIGDRLRRERVASFRSLVGGCRLHPRRRRALPRAARAVPRVGHRLRAGRGPRRADRALDRPRGRRHRGRRRVRRAATARDPSTTDQQPPAQPRRAPMSDQPEPEAAEAVEEQLAFDVADFPGGISGAIEAVLMVVDEPVTTMALASVLEQPVADVEAALAELEAGYAEQRRGFTLRQVGGGWRMYSRHEYAPVVEKFVLDGQQARLTQASLETLAVIAYRQPVSRSRVAAVRGVNVDGVIRTLLTRGLIEEMGHDEESTAILYGTTSYFLERLGLQSLDDLPALAPYLPEVDVLDEIAEGGRG